MGYVLHGCPGSGSAIVECALALVGESVELRDVDLGADAQRGADYAALNPQRKLPTLVTPDGETLTETAAIALTLDERYPDAGLLPPLGGRDRATALRWMVFVVAEIYPVVEINDYPERFASDAARAPAVRERARALWRERWLVVENAIAGEPWLLPSGLCITDVFVAVVSRWAQQQEWRPDAIPKVEAIAAAVAAHPVLAPVWRRHWT